MPDKNQSKEGLPIPPALIRTLESDAQTLIKSATPAQLLTTHPSSPPLAPSFSNRGALTKILGVIIVLIVGGAFSIPFLISRFRPIAPAQSPVISTSPSGREPAPLRASLFATEKTRAVAIDGRDREGLRTLVKQLAVENERTGTVTQIAVSINDGPRERSLAPLDFFNFANLNPPEGLRVLAQEPVMPFVYYKDAGFGIFGVAFKVRDVDRALRDFFAWERTLPAELATFLALASDEMPSAAQFQDRTYHNIDVRELPLPAPGTYGVSYAFFPALRIVILAQQPAAIEKAIDRLFDVR
mgnify:FL=1